MTKLEIVDSGVAQFTKRQKLLYRLETGLAQSNDQDKYVFDAQRGIFAVADGVGGMPFGAEAAQAACDAFYDELCADDHEFISSEKALYLAQSSLARIIHTAAAETAGFTTFTGVYRIDEQRIAYLHAGDSELLLRRNNYVRRVTSVQHQAGNVLTNYMGGSARGTTELAIESNLPSMHSTEWGLLRLHAGDRLVLATDGVTDVTYQHNPDNAWWLQQMDLHPGAQALAHYLVRASPRLDDSTAIVVDFGAA